MKSLEQWQRYSKLVWKLQRPLKVTFSVPLWETQQTEVTIIIMMLLQNVCILKSKSAHQCLGVSLSTVTKKM